MQLFQTIRMPVWPIRISEDDQLYNSGWDTYESWNRKKRNQLWRTLLRKPIANRLSPHTLM